MLQDVGGLSGEDARSKFVFVLVYNGVKLGGQGSANSPNRRVNEAQHFGHIRRSVTKHAKTNDGSAPRIILGIGNSIKNIFVNNYIYCDKSNFDDALCGVLDVAKSEESSATGR